VTAFLTTDLTEERHKRRVGKIDSVEKQYKR
jgi:ribose 5-phosphate isomerase RpiB